MDNIFESILDEDEKIIKTFKPIKSVFFIKNNLLLLFFTLVITAPIFIGLICDNMLVWYFSLLIWLGTFVVVFLLANLLFNIYYKNIYYAYSSKRIIIRTGIFGVDFKSLDVDMIGASTVNVSLFDKILKKNTGCLKFGSMASPMGMQTNSGFFALSNIENPYNIYKEIKSFIGTQKQTSTKTQEKI